MSAARTVPGPDVARCPRCQALVFRLWDEWQCLNCGALREQLEPDIEARLRAEAGRGRRNGRPGRGSPRS